MWASGAYTMDQICKEIGAHRNTLARIFKLRKVKKGDNAAAIAVKAQENLERQRISEADQTTQRINETKNNAYRLLSVIERLTASEITTAKANGFPMASIGPAVKALRGAAETILVTWRGRAEILGIDKEMLNEADLPSLMISEMTNEQIREVQRKQNENDIENEIALVEESLLNDAQTTPNTSRSPKEEDVDPDSVVSI